MRRSLARTLWTAALALAVAAPVAAHGAAPSPKAQSGVHIVVLRENGAGSRAAAQRYIDQVMESVARVNGWDKAIGAYHTSRRPAKAWIDANDPHYGILSLTAFLGMRKAMKLSVVGKADVKGGGGEQYYIVSKTAKDLAGCKGQSLATNHADDKAFIEGVVFAGKMKLSDFELQKTRRPLQTVKAALRDEATCALIDDAQMSDLANVEGGAQLEPVWFSAKLPPMVVVSFPSAPKAEAAKFKSNLSKVCAGPGASACKSAGIESLSPASKSDYAKVIKTYR